MSGFIKYKAVDQDALGNFVAGFSRFLKRCCDLDGLSAFQAFECAAWNLILNLSNGDEPQQEVSREEVEGSLIITFKRIRPEMIRPVSEAWVDLCPLLCTRVYKELDYAVDVLMGFLPMSGSEKGRICVHVHSNATDDKKLADDLVAAANRRRRT